MPVPARCGGGPGGRGRPGPVPGSLGLAFPSTAAAARCRLNRGRTRSPVGRLLWLRCRPCRRLPEAVPRSCPPRCPPPGGPAVTRCHRDPTGGSSRPWVLGLNKAAALGTINRFNCAGGSLFPTAFAVIKAVTSYSSCLWVPGADRLPCATAHCSVVTPTVSAVSHFEEER